MCYLGRFIWNCETRPVFICESVTLLTQKLHHNLANTRGSLCGGGLWRYPAPPLCLGSEQKVENTEDAVLLQKAAEQLHFQQTISGCILNHPRHARASKAPETARGRTPASAQSRRARERRARTEG